MGCMKLVLNDVQGRHMFQCNQGLKNKIIVIVKINELLSKDNQMVYDNN